MEHQTGTPSELLKVAGHTRLHRRGNRYYIRAKISADLRRAGVYGKREDIKKALKTSDPNEALRLVKIETLRLDAEFEAKRRIINAGATSEKRGLLTDRDAYAIVASWFIELEAEADQAFEEFRSLSPDDRSPDWLTDFDEGLYVYLGEHVVNFYDPSEEAELLLKKAGIGSVRNSNAYKLLTQLVRNPLPRSDHGSVNRAPANPLPQLR